ncbi:MAG: GH3 auxin-responsive promoter family protein [Pyrinomonadaceae bacterium]|nr:GH3 auxin-responsive promoter family protein [Pyrinomonadaceae bacterium]
MPELLKHARTLRGRIASILLDRACANPTKAQRSYLLRLLRRNAATAFGRAHGFSCIRSEADFRSRVPVREYEDFRPFVERIIASERNVLTAEEPFMLALTSGTTSEPKYIPVTRTLQHETASLMAVWLYRAERDHRGLLNQSSVGIVSRAVEGHANGIPYGSTSGLIYKNIPAFVRRAYAVPYIVSEIDDYDARYFATARFALARKVSFIATPNPSTLLRLAEVVAENQEGLIRAVHDGTLGAEIKQREIRAQLSSMLRPDPLRARELERVIKTAGFLRAGDCWRDLLLIGCWTGGSASVKLARLEKFYGRVPLRDLGYLASEGRITVPFEDRTASGIPAIRSGYYEFIAEEEMERADARALSICELEVGRRYSILLTTSGGLYRYKINDIVEVTGFHQGAPLLAFVRKGGEMADITGEKMHVNHFIEAVREVARRFQLTIEQFRAAPDREESRYEIYLELEQQVPLSVLQSEVLPALDRALAKVNVEYEQKRRSKRLSEPRINLMARGWSQREMRRHIQTGRRDTQYKWQILCPEKRAEDEQEITSTVGTGLVPARSVSDTQGQGQALSLQISL